MASDVSARVQSATCRHGHGKAEVTQAGVVMVGHLCVVRQSKSRQILFTRNNVILGIGFVVIATVTSESPETITVLP